MQQQAIRQAEAEVQQPAGVRGLDRAMLWMTRHWLTVVNLGMGTFVGGTLLAPVLMRLGLNGPARLVYLLYSMVCHQLPERSYFLFGPHGVDTYSRAQVIAWGADPAYLRGFVGNAQVGFKVGIAERDLAIYVTLLAAGLGYALVRQRVRGLSRRAFGLLILPMALDGGSHLLSELTGLRFRETNAWLGKLTGSLLPAAFYTGTTIGSFNWLMRTLTGALFAVAVVWFAYPILEQGFGDVVRVARTEGERDAAPSSQAERPANPGGKGLQS
jgi:uncharacterized membrane protein